MRHFVEGFSEKISILFLSSNLGRMNNVSLKFFTYKMAIDFYMFGASMVCWIVNYINCGFVVTKDCGGIGDVYLQILKQGMKP